MRKLLLSSAIVLSLVGGAPVLAKSRAKPVEGPSATASPHAECVRQWKAEKSHTQTRKAFLAACGKA